LLFAKSIVEKLGFFDKKKKVPRSSNPEDIRKIADVRFHHWVMISYKSALLIQFIVNAHWYSPLTSLTPNTTAFLIFFWIGAAVIIFTTEFRVRKFEIASALVSRTVNCEVNIPQK
jgi:hypothetical protein